MRNHDIRMGPELEARGEVNVFGVEDLESFLDASLLLPRAVIADFNFPDWHYYGRGSGQERAYHRYELVRGMPRHSERMVERETA